MSTAPVEPTTAAPTEPPAAAVTPPVPAPPTSPPKATEPPANPWSDPVAAEAEIKRLRAENAKDRTTSKAQAADEAKKEYAQVIAKALGLVEDDAADPAKLTASLTTAQTEAKRARVELAVFKTASTAGGDPAALLDSSSFLAKLDSIDPSDTAAVTAAIEAAVAANPRLGAATADPRPPAPNPAQGTSAAGGSGFDQQIAEATAAGNHQLAIHLKQRRAAALAKKS